LLLISALLSSVAAVYAQDEPTIRVDVRLVRIIATVKDGSGQLTGELNKSDFTITDNGARQDIAVFERQTETPLSVAILIDNSGSTAKDLRYEVDSVNRFTRALVREGNPRDAAALYSFNWEVVKQQGFTRNTAAIDHALRLLHGEAGTSLYDALLLASRDIQDREGRKVLVVVTDGGDTVSRSSFDRAVEAAQLADAVIYPILVMPITNDAGRNIGGENALTTFAERTGGRVFAPSVGAAMDQAFDQILRDLRTQYLIGFYPHEAPLTKDRFHRLGVGVDRIGYRVAARSGYYGEALQDATAPVSRPASSGSADETVRPKKPGPPPPAPKKGRGPYEPRL
jgi:Ca-activated chloride channel family protein